MNRASGKPAARATDRLLERRLSQAELREQARKDGIVQERRGRFSKPPGKALAAPLKRLQEWAGVDTDRVFEIRYVAAAPHPWAVELSDEAVSWSAKVDGYDSFDRAVDRALEEAAKEELA